MSLQAASLGRFWLGPQTARGIAATGTYYPMKANMINVGGQQLTTNVGQLVGGSFMPGDSVKTAAFSGGSLVMPPALDDYIGWLLYSFAGSVSSVNNGDSTYTHYFPQAADSTAPTKYLTARRSVPGTAVMYEQMIDMIPARMMFGFTPGEFTTLRADLLGRTPSNPDGSAWSFSGAKGQSSIPIGCSGTFELPDGTPVETSSAVQLDLQNIVPNIQDVLTLGSYYPFDFPVLGRNITVSFQHLWETKDLYTSMYYSGGTWNLDLYNTTLDFEVESNGYITGSLPYKLRFYGANVQWQCQPLELRGGDLVRLQMVGTVAAATSGFDWYLALTNGTATYAWPGT